MTDPRSLDERYGRSRRRRIDRRLGWIIAAVLVIGPGGVLASAWLYSQGIETRDLDYRVIDGRSASLLFEVTSPSDRPLACAIEAQSESHSQVGWLVREYPASDQRTRRFNETVLTTSPATTITVRSCWNPESDGSAGRAS